MIYGLEIALKRLSESEKYDFMYDLEAFIFMLLWSILGVYLYRDHTDIIMWYFASSPFIIVFVLSYWIPSDVEWTLYGNEFEEDYEED